MNLGAAISRIGSPAGWLRSWRAGRAPAGGAVQAVRPRGRARRFSSLTARLLMFNFLVFFAMLAGAWGLLSLRMNPFEERLKSLQMEASAVAVTLARHALDKPPEQADEATGLDPDKTADAIGPMINALGVRGQVFSNRGVSLHDTRFQLARGQVINEVLLPPGEYDVAGRLQASLKKWFFALRPGPKPTGVVSDGVGMPASHYPEVIKALTTGNPANAIRYDNDGRVFLSVAMPVRRLEFILGVVMVATEAGDIDEALRVEWVQMLAGALGVFVFTSLASLFLLRYVTGPVVKLSQAAQLVRGEGRSPDALPDLSRRHDEVGDLSVSLREMTSALYARMDAIEQFAADVAHEIKNPLTSVASAVDILQRTTDEEKRTRLLGVIKDDVRRLDRLITGISDASRLDAELSRAKAEPVDLCALAAAIVHMFDDPDHPERPRVTLAMPPQPVVVRGLDGPLAQVLRNVIENAVSFSPAGGAVHVVLQASGGRAVVTVDDQGPGIPEDNLEVIFRRFYTSRPQSHGFGRNSGLGLSISRQIIDVHEGTINASNLRDETGAVRGARFTITLPLAAQSGP